MKVTPAFVQGEFIGLKAKVAEAEGKAFGLNRELNRQLALIAQVVKTRKIPVVFISQVRSVLDQEESTVEPVATRVLKFWADTIIAMKPLENPQIISAVIEKPASEPNVACQLRISLSGIHDYPFY
jgi:RecA/RadA recombinase